MAEIPCHAVKSPLKQLTSPEIRSCGPGAASCNTSELAERDLAGSAAKSKGLQREDNIFYWKPSKRQQEKKGSVHTPDTRPARWAVCPLGTGRVAKATASPGHLPKKAAKFLTDGTDTDTGANLLSGGLLTSVAAQGIRSPSSHRPAMLPPDSSPQFPYL